MTAKVLLNPYAHRWKAREMWEQAAEALTKAGVGFSLDVSQSAEDLQALAHRAVLDGFSPIIIAGGDGTLGTALNGLAQAYDDDAVWGPVGILPLGTANDFVDNVHLPTDLQGAVDVIAAGHIRHVDVCRVNDRYFINNTALGAEAKIAWRQNQMRYARGIWRYLAAAAIELASLPSWDAVIEWDNGGRYEGKITLLSVGNGRRTGGVYYTVPDADPFDGKLTFVHGYTSSRGRLVALMRRLMDAERPYTMEPEIHQHHASFVRVRLQQPSPSHADGEMFATAETEFEYQIFPGKLALLMP